MREATAQTVLLVRAFEEADPDGRVLSHEDRRRATDEARAAAGSNDAEAIEANIAARAHRLLESLEANVPGIPRFLARTRLLAGLGPVLVGGGFVVGLLLNELGPSRRVSLVPLVLVLLALIAWNLFVYATLLVWAFRRPQGENAASAASAASATAERADGGRLSRFAGHVLEWAAGRFSRATSRRKVRDAGIVSAAVTRFVASWRRAVAPVLASRARLAFHLGSLSLALGIVVGMFVRGLGFRYEATWESTFLDPDAFRRLLAFVFGPAAALIGRAVPSAHDVALMADPLSGKAAPWIVLYAVTAAIYVIAPRLLLALVERAVSGRLARNVHIDLGTSYASRAGGAGAMPGARVEVLPYSHHPSPRAADALRALLHDVFGTEAEIAMREPLAYGCEIVDVPRPDGAGPACRVLLFALAQTPETEVHGRLLREVRDARRPIDGLVVLGDASTYRERLGDAERVAERRRLWERIAKEAGVAFVGVDLGSDRGGAESVEAVAGRLAAAVRGEARGG